MIGIVFRCYVSRFRCWLSESHTYNTDFNYNWVNVRPIIETLRKLEGLLWGLVVNLGARRSPYYDLVSPGSQSYIALEFSRTPKRKSRDIDRAGGVAEAIPFLTTPAINP